MSLVWTTDTPTEPGRYLCQVGPREYMGYVSRNTIAKTLVFHGINRIGESITGPADVPVASVKWAGPIHITTDGTAKAPCSNIQPARPDLPLDHLDQGVWLPGKQPRKKPEPKSKEELAAIRAKAWASTTIKARQEGDDSVLRLCQDESQESHGKEISTSKQREEN